MSPDLGPVPVLGRSWIRVCCLYARVVDRHSNGVEFALSELLLSPGLLCMGAGRYSLAGVLPGPLRKL